MEGQDEFEEPAGVKYQVMRILVLTVSCLSYVFVYFHRTCTSALATKIAENYGEKDVTKLSIFSSIFFYPYGILQFFAGILADIIEPSFLVGGSQLLASIGGIICGASKSIGVGCFGRVLVGLGCGPTYVPCTRMLLNWFPATWYAFLIGVLAAIGCCGGIIANRPLVSFAEYNPYPYAFYGMGAISAILAILCMIFIRGHPNSKGFKGPNGPMTNASADITFVDRLKALWTNLKVVAHRWDFWVVVVYCIIGNAPMFSFTAMWAQPFLKDFFRYDVVRAGDTGIATTIGIIIGSLAFGPLSNVLKTRKWVCLGVCIGAMGVSIGFYLLKPQQPEADVPANGVVWIMLIIFGATTIAIPGVAYPLVREYYPPAQAGTAVGLANSCGFLSTAVYQEISTAIIKSYGLDPDDELKKRYKRDGYKYGLWLFYLISFIVSGVLITIVRDTEIFKKADSGGGEPEATKDDKGEKEADSGSGEKDAESAL
jgi:sugar phosphate permease